MGEWRTRAHSKSGASNVPFVSNELPIGALDGRYANSKPDPRWRARLAAATPRDALSEIMARARDTNIVILNEAHYSPRDRAFGLEVARALRPLGYDVFAAETFSNWKPNDDGTTAIDQLIRDHVVRFGTGNYTIDPVFAGFVRGTLTLGYEPVAYEQTAAQSKPDDGIAEREEAQANNLMAAIFTKRPRAKTLIYVGFSHVGERPVGDENFKFMAARLKDKTGIDPLTIDQTTIVDLLPQARPAYALAASRIGRRSAIFFEKGQPLVLGPAGDGRSAVDLQVVHPARAYLDGRPTWIKTLGGKPLRIPPNLVPSSGRRLVQAFAMDAPPDAVPLDQTLVEASRPVPKLMVPSRSAA